MATLKALRMYIIKVMFRIIKTICKLYTITDILFLRLKKRLKWKTYLIKTKPEMKH